MFPNRIFLIMNNLRVLHLSTSMHGGAGMAATRLHTALVDSKVDSMIVYREHSDVPESHNLKIKMRDMILGKIVTVFSRLVTNEPYSMVTPYTQNMISKAQIRKLAPDVVHIHNWFNFLDEQMINWLITNYSVVFTLHDSRIYTGGCHYSLKCRGFEQNCKSCPAIKINFGIASHAKARMKQALNINSDYHVITPSSWLLRELQKSELLRPGVEVSVISNVIDGNINSLNVFEPKKSKCNFLFIAADISNPNKGLALLLDALSQSRLNNEESRLVIVGSNTNKIKPPNNLQVRLKFTGELGRDELYSQIKSASLLIIPSIADNLPSVIAEAQLAGTPVLATEVGGIPDLISDGKTGFLCSPTPESIAAALIRFISSLNIEQIVSNAKNTAAERHSPEKIVSEHLQIYRTLHAKN